MDLDEFLNNQMVYAIGTIRYEDKQDEVCLLFCEGNEKVLLELEYEKALSRIKNSNKTIENLGIKPDSVEQLKNAMENSRYPCAILGEVSIKRKNEHRIIVLVKFISGDSIYYKVCNFTGNTFILSESRLIDFARQDKIANLSIVDTQSGVSLMTLHGNVPEVILDGDVHYVVSDNMLTAYIQNPNITALELPEFIGDTSLSCVNRVFIDDITNSHKLRKIVFPSCIRKFDSAFLGGRAAHNRIEHIVFKADNISVSSDAFTCIKNSLSVIEVKGKDPWFGDMAFMAFNQLTRVEFEQEPLRVLTRRVFYGCGLLDISCVLKEGLIAIDDMALGFCNTYDKRISLPSSLRVVSIECFGYVRGIREVEFNGTGLSVYKHLGSDKNILLLLESDRGVDFYIRDIAEIDTSLIHPNVNLIKLPPCEADKKIKKMRSKFRMLTGGADCGFIGCGRHDLKTRQTILGAIPSGFIREAMIKLTHEFLLLNIINSSHSSNDRTPFMLDYMGLRLSICFHIHRTKGTEHLNDYNTSDFRAKILDDLYLFGNDSVVIVMPISKELVLQSDKDNNDCELGTDVGSVNIFGFELDSGIDEYI